MRHNQSYQISRLHFALLALLLVAAVVFLELAGDVWLNEGFDWDAPLMLAIHQHSHPWLDNVFIAVTQTAGLLILLPLSVAVIVFWRRGEQLEAITLLAAFGGSVAINALLKVIFARPRPTVFPPLTVETSYSFPSGHTMSAVAFYGLLAVFLWRRRRYGWALLSGLWPLAVGFSRIYLGVHYPSDALAALAVGLLWLLLVVTVSDRYYANRQSSPELPL